jgi:hypothetical protein
VARPGLSRPAKELADTVIDLLQARHDGVSKCRRLAGE